MDKTRFKTRQDELDYWVEIEKAAKERTGVPEHDCGNLGTEPQGCQTCEDYAESREWWIEQKSKQISQSLEL